MNPWEAPPENFYKPHDNKSHTLLTIAAAYMIGAWIDNNTKFGWWINNSATANLIFAVLKGAAIMVAMTLVIMYCYFFFTI